MDTNISRYKCIAIMGGTFNPVHMGHIMMAREAIRRVSGIERLFFMPNNLPAYKEKGNLTSAKHRVNMLRLAISPYHDMEVSTLEIERGGITYTADTLDELMSEAPDLRIYFIIGADSLNTLHKWHRYRDVLAACSLIVFDRKIRGGIEKEPSSDVLSRARIEYIRDFNADISSSGIRRLISEGTIPYNLLPDGVADYIEKNSLYRGNIHEQR